MSLSDKSSTNGDFRYVGSELEVFSQAANWKRYFSRVLRPYIRGHVLEVGAGIGTTTRILASGAEESWTCLEPDAELMAALQETIGDPSFSLAGRLKTASGTIADIPAGELFDTILYIDVLEHIADDAAELEAAAQHLSAAGHLVVLSPAHQWLYSPFDKAIGHYRRYDRKTLQAAGPAGRRLVRLQYLDSVGIAASLANKLLFKSSRPTVRQILVWDRLMVPVSRLLDPLLGFRLGKTLVAIWRR